MGTMSLEASENEAKARAAKRIANKFQRPDQLEKVEQYRKRVSRQKATVETMLKTTMKSQLDGVRSGLNQFRLALEDLKEIKMNIQEIEESLTDIPKLVDKLKDVKNENIKHSQYAAAMENLRQIFTVPESVEKTKAQISEGKLLLAYPCLADLENSRDDLLYELHKLPNQNPSDITMLQQYFADVEQLSNMLAKQLWLILKRTLNTVRKEPTVIVTALRLIEREERADEFALLRQKETGFLPTGRPKSWRQKAFDILEEAVHERIEGNQFEERKDAKMWLVRHLEVTRQLVLEDLRVVKTLCTPCFPPHYHIFDRYVEMYHRRLSMHLQEILTSGLEGNEFVTLLEWLNNYHGPDLLGHPDLKMDPQKMRPLLDNATVDSIIQHYLNFLKQNYEEWMKNALDTDIKDWYRDVSPEADGDGYFNTVVPVIVFQMIDQNLQVAKTVGGNLVGRVLLLSMQQVMLFVAKYQDAITEFKNRCFEDRSKVKYFTHYMVATANNCLHFIDLSRQLQKHFRTPGFHDNEMGKTLEDMIRTFDTIGSLAIGSLLEEVFLDLEPHFKKLVTKPWLKDDIPLDTICCTLEDYCVDYRHLRSKYYNRIIIEAQKKVCKSYMTAILSKRMTFSNYDERRATAEKIIKEADMINKLFARLNAESDMMAGVCDIIISLAEVLKVQDTEFLSLELSGMVRKYPDMTQDHLTALLSLREDMGRSDVKQLVSEIIPERRDTRKTPEPKSLFSELELQVQSVPLIQNIMNVSATGHGLMM